MTKLGAIVFMSDSGLGLQSVRLCHMLIPNRILAINSSSFSKNKQQHPEWYSSFTGYRVDGFPTNHEIRTFFKGLTHVIVAENPLNQNTFKIAKQMGVKLLLQNNPEFTDHFIKPELELPYKFLAPSYWMLDEMIDKFGEDKVIYLPPPIDPNEFKDAREINFQRTDDKRRFLHIVGTLAHEDRNGTLDLLESLEYTKSDFELVIRSQHELPREYIVNDKRVRYQIENIKDVQDMYKNFDALILPRRYGGLSLTTNEALMSGLPVIMTNISPNNQLLESDWLVKAKIKKQTITRTVIDVYGSDIKDLAKKIDEFVNMSLINLDREKLIAFELGYNEFSPSKLKNRYMEVINE